MNLSFPLRVKAVVIDLDGTLADTIPDLAEAANMMLRELGRPGLERELIRTFVGKGIPKLVERALAGSLEGSVPAGLLARALPIYERCYAEVNGKHTVIFPGVSEGLRTLRAMQLPLACVTNKAERFTLALLEQLQLARCFEQVIAGDTLAKKKPDPLQLLHAAEQFNVSPERSLMVGDSINDVEAARAAGFQILCVSYGYNLGRDIREANPDAVVDTLNELPRLLETISA